MKYAIKYLKHVRALRQPVIWGMSLGSNPSASNGWIKFPMYHQLGVEQVSNFTRQLDYMKRIGDFISLDEALNCLKRGDIIDGRYFCLTFDDGYKNAITNAYPILVERNIPGTFFIVPHFIDMAAIPSGAPVSVNTNNSTQYLTWEDCRRMSNGGMTIGSHSLSHRNFLHLSETEARQELLLSKKVISEQIGQECNHFACPWGQPHETYIPDRDPELAKQAGYHSFMSTTRGSVRQGHKSIVLPRDRVEPHWGLYQLKYFYSRHGRD